MFTQPALFDLQRAFAGHYSFLRELGRGGMGSVSLAREVELDAALRSGAHGDLSQFQAAFSRSLA